MDLAAIRTRVRDVLRDADKKFIADSEIDAWANEAQLDIVARTNVLQKTQSGSMGDAGTSVANGTIDLPADSLDITSLRLGTEDDVQFVDDEVWNSWSDASATPLDTIARVFDGKIELYPKPTSGTAYRLRYEKKPVALSGVSDVPEIPEHLHIKLVNYGRAHGKWKEDDGRAGDRYFQLYEENLPRPPSGRERLIPGPLTLVPAASAWDDTDTRH